MSLENDLIKYREQERLLEEAIQKERQEQETRKKKIKDKIKKAKAALSRRQIAKRNHALIECGLVALQLYGKYEKFQSIEVPDDYEKIVKDFQKFLKLAQEEQKTEVYSKCFNNKIPDWDILPIDAQKKEKP